MTLSDPLLKELKAHIGTLVASGPGPYTDDDEAVFLICHTLESIFQKGLVRHDGFTPWRTDSFHWIHQLVRKYNRVLPLTFRGAFDDIMGDRKTRTNSGKMRLLIRHCLKRRCLHTPVEFHVENRDFEDANLRVNYNPMSSVLGHEILSQIFLSLLLQLSHFEFAFDLTNASFLDESWQIPKLFKTELVPCDKLGLTLGFPMGYAVIVAILENSVASELGNKVEVGDIMDDFNGTPVRHFYGSKIESLFKKFKKEPFKITFIKSKDPATSQIFLPAIKLYRILGLCPDLLNYPEPMYRRHEKSLANTEFDQTTETDGDGCDALNTGASALSKAQEEQLIDVEVYDQTQSDNANHNDVVNSSYMELLASLADPPSSSLDLLTADIPELLCQEEDAPAQLLMEPTANGESGSILEPERTAENRQHSRESHEERMNCGACKYYDDSTPFLV